MRGRQDAIVHGDGVDAQGKIGIYGSGLGACSMVECQDGSRRAVRNIDFAVGGRDIGSDSACDGGESGEAGASAEEPVWR